MALSYLDIFIKYAFFLLVNVFVKKLLLAWKRLFGLIVPLTSKKTYKEKLLKPHVHRNWQKLNSLNKFFF